MWMRGQVAGLRGLTQGGFPNCLGKPWWSTHLGRQFLSSGCPVTSLARLLLLFSDVVDFLHP